MLFFFFSSSFSFRKNEAILGLGPEALLSTGLLTLSFEFSNSLFYNDFAKSLSFFFVFTSAALLVQVSRAQMDLQERGMAGMEGEENTKHKLESPMVTCTSLSILDVEEVAQGDWVEA